MTWEYDINKTPRINTMLIFYTIHPYGGDIFNQSIADTSAEAVSAEWVIEKRSVPQRLVGQSPKIKNKVICKGFDTDTFTKR